MSEDGEDIEFLDEDAEIVQKCVQTSQAGGDAAPNFSIETELLVERLPSETKLNRKKKRVEVDDDDYDPVEHRGPRSKQRKTQQGSDTKKASTPNSYRNTLQQSKSKKEPEKAPETVDLKRRKLMDIRVPDYEDPLCLPVRAIVRDRDDGHKLRTWNNLCLEKFKLLDKPLRINNDETVASKRIIELRNVQNSLGKVDTAIYGKTIVQNKTGVKKCETVHSILPRYREKKLLNNFKLRTVFRKHPMHHKTEFILRQETSEHDEALVIYNPDECVSFVYKMYDKARDPKVKDEDKKFYLKETDCQKMCAPCYHATYKGYESIDPNNYCHICKRIFLNSKILMSHLKSHTREEKDIYKKKLAKELSMRAYRTFKCRICLRKFMGATALKKHVPIHKGLETPFECEAGRHLVR